MCQNVCIGCFCVLGGKEDFMKKVEMEMGLEILAGLVQAVRRNRAARQRGNEYGWGCNRTTSGSGLSVTS